MERPDAATIREATPRADWAGMGYAEGEEPDSLEAEVQFAIDYVEWVTGRPQDASMPPGLERIALAADALRVVQQANIHDPEQQEALFGGQTLKSFSVTGYSESYPDVGTAVKAENEARMVNPWPELDRLLWMMMTPEKFAYWRAFLAGGLVPQWGVLEVDWSGANRWGGYSSVGGGGIAGDWPGFGDVDGWPGIGAWPTGSNTGMVLPD